MQLFYERRFRAVQHTSSIETTTNDRSNKLYYISGERSTRQLGTNVISKVGPTRADAHCLAKKNVHWARLRHVPGPPTDGHHIFRLAATRVLPTLSFLLECGKMIEIQWSKAWPRSLLLILSTDRILIMMILVNRILELQYEYVSPSWQASVPPSVPKFGTRALFYTSTPAENAVGYSESIVLCKNLHRIRTWVFIVPSNLSLEYQEPSYLKRHFLFVVTDLTGYADLPTH
ncbi:hypothetical protein IW262DRAFT_984195 [Armillaria fumosa]|nr:hypothetical protein IW262DRAFT_984195 [Armillaria fumosa]